LSVARSVSRGWRRFWRECFGSWSRLPLSFLRSPFRTRKGVGGYARKVVSNNAPMSGLEVVPDRHTP
jgi:hypothetical protein